MQTKPQSSVTPDRLMQFGFGYAPTLIIEAAVRLRVFDVLENEPKTVEQVSEETGASVRGLTAIMNALVGFDFLGKDGDRYLLTPESATFLVSGKPSYFGGLFRHISDQLLPKWMNLTEVVRSGSPSVAVNFESDGSNFFKEFVEDLFPLSFPSASTLAQALEISKSETPVSVLDLAAGSGVWGIALAQTSPNVRVTAVDWSGVLEVTRRISSRVGLADRFNFVEGDLLEADFGSGHHIATLGHILHTEGEARSRALIKKAYQALAPGGTISIAEFLVNEEHSGPPQAVIFAVNMLVNTAEGDTFSFGEISEWLSDAGFVDMRLLEVAGPSPLVLATKPEKAS